MFVRELFENKMKKHCVLSYIILYYIILYYIILYCIILYYIIFLNCIIFLYCIIFYYIVLYCIIVYYSVLYYLVSLSFFPRPPPSRIKASISYQPAGGQEIPNIAEDFKARQKAKRKDACTLFCDCMAFGNW